VSLSGSFDEIELLNKTIMGMSLFRENDNGAGGSRCQTSQTNHFHPDPRAIHTLHIDEGHARSLGPINCIKINQLLGNKPSLGNS